MGKVEKDLFRALRKDDFKGDFHVEGVAADGLLYPRFFDTNYTDGKGLQQTSRADVDIKKNAQTNALEVQPGGGTSLFDQAGMFGHGYWRYFRIPEGTEFSEGLVVHKSKHPTQNRSRTMSAYHHQIEPKNPMTVDALKGALDTFARNAVVRTIELSRSNK